MPCVVAGHWPVGVGPPGRSSDGDDSDRIGLAGGGLCREEEWTIPNPLCPSHGEGQLLPPKPPNFFWGGGEGGIAKWSKIPPKIKHVMRPLQFIGGVR